MTKYELKYPINKEGLGQLSVLEIRRPTYGDMKQVSGLENIEASGKLIELLCKDIYASVAMRSTVADLLDVSDFQEISQLIENFTKATSRKNG